jgi:hypothetical protein
VIIVHEEGRELSDCPGAFSRTVGQFGTRLPVEVTSYGQPDLIDILRQTKESYWQNQNWKNTPYTRTRYLILKLFSLIN